MDYDYIILGAGIAGLTAAGELRRLCPSSSILLVDRETRLPYKRTKLSKELSTGFEKKDFSLFPLSWYDQNRISLVTGVEAVQIQTQIKSVSFSDLTQHTYGKLLLALGARPIVPQGFTHVQEWLVLRNQTQGERLHQACRDLDEVCILGSGVLGVEIAEQMILTGKSVKLFSRHPLPLHRDLTEEASLMLKTLLEDRGVALQKSCNSSKKTAIAAAGSHPDTELAAQTGLAVKTGILVDEGFKTSDPHIWAAGDCAELPYGRITHLWHESEAQALAAAQFMSGREEPFFLRPYRLKLDVFGEYYFSMNKPEGAWWDREERRRDRRYQCFFFHYDNLHGVVMANDKDRKDLYEQAVIESWSRDRVLRELGY